MPKTSKGGGPDGSQRGTPPFSPPPPPPPRVPGLVGWVPGDGWGLPPFAMPPPPDMPMPPLVMAAPCPVAMGWPTHGANPRLPAYPPRPPGHPASEGSLQAQQLPADPWAASAQGGTVTGHSSWLCRMRRPSLSPTHQPASARCQPRAAGGSSPEGPTPRPSARPTGPAATAAGAGGSQQRQTPSPAAAPAAAAAQRARVGPPPPPAAARKQPKKQRAPDFSKMPHGMALHKKDLDRTTQQAVARLTHLFPKLPGGPPSPSLACKASQ